MTSVQRVIKYLAIGLAIFIIVSIVSAIVFGIRIIGIVETQKKEVPGLKTVTDFKYGKLTNLKVELAYSKLIIKNGDKVQVESNNPNISCKQNNNQLTIKEKDNNWFSRKNEGEVVIYLPEEVELDVVKIETGAGQIWVQELNTKQLILEIGAGTVEIEKLNVTQKAKIEGGAGRVSILSSEINNLDLDMGVGKFELRTKLTGKNDIDAGIGRLDIDLIDEIENYKVKVEKGIGSIKIEGKEVSNNTEMRKWRNIN